MINCRPLDNGRKFLEKVTVFTKASSHFIRLHQNEYMKVKLTLSFVCWILFFVIDICKAQKPNIVVVMADDIGIGDIGFYHQQRTGKRPIVPTPNLDKLIKKGMRFYDAHSPASLCAPTRFSMITGNFSYRNAQRPWGVWQPAMDAGIEPNYLSVARIAKAGGYTTAFLGKWGLGGMWDSWPEEQSAYRQVDKGAQYYGFDYSLELPQGIQSKPYIFYENGQWMKLKADSKLDNIPFEQTKYDEDNHSKNREGVGDSNWDPVLAGPILAQKAVNFINQQSKSKKTFFMYYCSQAVHIPHTPAEKLNGKKIAGTTLGRHGDMIKELDAQVGMILKALRKNGLYQNTLFVFTSDNGGLKRDRVLINAGHDSSNGFRGSKGSIYEGGHRVPFIVVWPGIIKPGSESKITIVGQDMVATIASIVGMHIDRSKVLDSANLLPVFKQASKQPLHKYLMHQSQSRGGPYYALREGNWKLILKADKRNSFNNLKVIGLFDLSVNPFEEKSGNLKDAPEQKARISEMKSKYLELRKEGASTLY